jgi:hypothetical protein
MNKNTFEGSTIPIEENDQDGSDPVVNPNPSVLATLVQGTPTGSGFVAAEAEHEAIVDDVLLDEKVRSNLAPVDVSEKNIGSVGPLLSHDESEHFRTRWSEVQGKFVDEPRSAVQQADALVGEVIDKITAIFAQEHSSLEGQWKEGKDVSTEDLRKALQHYRSFFNRLVV